MIGLRSSLAGVSPTERHVESEPRVAIRDALGLASYSSSIESFLLFAGTYVLVAIVVDFVAKTQRPLFDRVRRGAS